MQVRGARISPGARHGHSTLPDHLLDGVGARTLRLGEPQIVVGAQIERLGGGAGQTKGEVVVDRAPIQQGDVAAGDADDGTGEAIVQAHLQSADVEVVEVAVERGVAILGLQVPIPLAPKALAEKVPNVTENDEDEVTDVGGKENEIVRFVDDGFRKLSFLESARVPMSRVAEGAELSVLTSDALGVFG